MTTIIIDDKSAGAKKMIEFVETLPYAIIIDDREPGLSSKKSMEEAGEGKTKEIKEIGKYFDTIRKRFNV